MTAPETHEYLVKAWQALGEARVMPANNLASAAGRAAYHAAFHAAQAFIFEATGRSAKTHSGVRSEFARLGRDRPAINRGLSAFLARSYALKESADYGIGASAEISLEEAKQAITEAERFVASVAEVLGAERAPPP